MRIDAFDAIINAQSRWRSWCLAWSGDRAGVMGWEWLPQHAVSAFAGSPGGRRGTIAPGSAGDTRELELLLCECGGWKTRNQM
jgi:hypothetical protein